MKLTQITFSTVGRLPLCPTRAERLLAVRTVVRVCGPELVLFCIVDEHVHTLVLEQSATRLAPRVRRALAAISEVGLQQPHLGEVESRRHVENLVGYFLTQSSRHGLREHPAFWEGSCLPDLVGARQLGRFDPTLLGQLLPRRSAVAWEAVGLSACEPASDHALADHGPRRIAAAAARAVGRVDLSGARGDASRARRAAAGLLHQLGYRAPQIAGVLDIPDRTARFLVQAPGEPDLERCIRMQVAIYDQVVSKALERLSA